MTTTETKTEHSPFLTVEIEQELTYRMVIELLAHQFAYPVRWIETQDVLLGEKKVDRIIEIGPSNTLTSIARKTVDAKYREHDEALSITRQLLCCKNAENEIYYNIEFAEDTPKETATEETTSTEVIVEAEPVLLSVQSTGMQLSKAVSDAPVTAVEIVSTLVAKSLKKSTKNVSMDSTIKAVVGGRSTLENEIIGDLLNEFGSMPERAEELKLKDLAETLQSRNFNGRLGKQSSMWLERMISAKMPGGYNITVAKQYLQTRWGLGVGRQESVLLSAIVEPPVARLATTEAANAYLDDTVEKYATAVGLSLDRPQVAQASSRHLEIDSEAMQAITKDYQELSKKKIELYAKYLGMDLRAGEKAHELSQKTSADLQSQLDIWTIEHGDFYASGVKPMMDAKKVRVYDSAWNWAMQDLLSIFHDVVLGRLEPGDQELVNRCDMICNRASQKLLEEMRYLLGVCGSERGNGYKSAASVIRDLINDAERSALEPPVFKALQTFTAPFTTIDSYGRVKVTEIPRTRESFDVNLEMSEKKIAATPQIKVKAKYGWEVSKTHSDTYTVCLEQMKRDGISFHGKNILLTGAGPSSIGSEILKGLVTGGARVIVTTSSYSTKTAQFYQSIYTSYGALGSQIVLVPFNQGSQQDIESLLAYIYDATKGLGWDLDFVIPFAAIKEEGSDIDQVDSKSELAHRIMLTNTIRLLGAVKRYKQISRSETRPAQVILPLSPNHGNFGNDGLYAESKMALESLFNKWWSEKWSSFLTICGASIGWTRGTNLMQGNDIIAEGIEKLGVQTFTQAEMASCILGLMAYPMVRICQKGPMYADLNGGLDLLPDLTEALVQLRQDITSNSEIRKAIADEKAKDEAIVNGMASAPQGRPSYLPIERCARFDLGFPRLPNFKDDILPLGKQLKDMIDLERAVVITGFAELGPYGNSRTRWEMEAYGKFSLEGCIEMAWMMGLIKHVNKSINGKKYVGWVDTKTEQPVKDVNVKREYEKYILEHSGIRIVEPELWGGYDPNKKQFLQEVIIQEDLEPFDTSEETAKDFKREHEDKAEIWQVPGSTEFSVRIKKGATIMVPKAIKFSNDVAGQIPTGWDPHTYGIGEDIISQVDPITLYTLVCTVEALLSSGISDPYEIYEYIHTSELGNCMSTSLGGITSAQKLHKGRYVEEPLQKDIFQESFINIMSAWVNMLLLSSNGPTRTQVGACATAIESLDAAHDLITTGQAKLCLVGGVDDLDEDVMFEFANMKATSNAEDERAKGRSPKEMSRPTASSRKGFMEAQGCGIQVVTTAQLALEMGLPIYAIVALTGTAGDKIGRSVPAPGKGILATAREKVGVFPSPLYNLSYRRRQLENRCAQIKEWKETETVFLGEEIATIMVRDPTFDATTYESHGIRHITLEAQRQEEDARNSFGNYFWRNHPEISPLRGALAAWGLTIDDLDVCSFHGTSTVMNEKNECEIMQKQLAHLGRKQGNKVLGVFQKHLTGHPKGPAGAWMINGCLQILGTGLVPGNSNADNVDEYLEQFDYIAFPNRSIQTDGIKAFSVTSFGFGQKGAQMIGVHPKYMFATLEEDVFEEYKRKVVARQRKATAFFNKALISNELFVAKEKTPFEETREFAQLLDPTVRIRRSE